MGVLIAGLALLLASGGAESEPTDFEKGLSLLQFSVLSERPVYHRGQPVRLILTLANPGDTPQFFSFRSSHQYDFVIRRENQQVWEWSAGRMFAQALTQWTLQPHETRTFRETWDQNGPNGEPASPGSYELVGMLLVVDRTYTATAAFTIEGSSPRGND